VQPLAAKLLGDLLVPIFIHTTDHLEMKAAEILTPSGP